jgi:hypothetical protein
MAFDLNSLRLCHTVVSFGKQVRMQGAREPLDAMIPFKRGSTVSAVSMT